MANKNGLKYQFRKQLIISIGLLVFVFSFLLYQLFMIGIGSTMHRTMLSMAEHYAKQAEVTPDFKLYNNDGFSVYIGRKALPDKIKKLFKLDDIEDYSFVVNDSGSLLQLNTPKNITFLIQHPINNSSNKLYLIHNDKPKLDNKPLKLGPVLNVPISIVLVTLLAILLVYWIVRRLIKKVLDPLNELAVMARSVDENNPELPFDILNNKTEIGVVAKALHQTMSRIHQYHQREKKFLQNASHELRTPIAVVSSSLDIIELRLQQGKTELFDQHTNIKRANKSMAELINALLLLSRKDSAEVSLEEVSLKALLTEVVEEHRYLIKGKRVTVELLGDDTCRYPLPFAQCKITLSNLIRNAFEHTSSGKVMIQLSKRSVLIKNTSMDAEDEYQDISEKDVEHSQGFGLGLQIVRKIVKQQQWQIYQYVGRNNGSKVVIIFEQKR